MDRKKCWSAALVLVALAVAQPALAQYTHPFENPDLPVEERIDNLLSLMTRDEKIEALGLNEGVPRLGVQRLGHTEGLHGVAQGGPSNWGRRKPVPTTQFPQAVGLGETWDADAVRQVATVMSYEARYLYQNPKYNQGGIVVWGPNADLARDICWGRTEESYGEDAWLAGVLSQAFVEGLQGDHPQYWRTASLMKHFLANSNEAERYYSTSNFDERLLREYYAVPFRMGIVNGGARAFMAAYNAVNGIPMTVHPMLEAMTVKEWGQDGIISTDGGALRYLIHAHQYYPDLAWGAAASIKAGINQFLDDYREPVRQALQEGLVTEAEIDQVLRGRYRVSIRLGQLDPPEQVPYRAIGAGDELEPWTTPEHQAIARTVTQKSIVLLKNEAGALPLDAGALRSIAVIGPRADQVLSDWYSGDTLYAVTPLEGIRARAGSGVTVQYASGADSTEAARLAQTADAAIVVVGNHPVCDAGWEECSTLSEGKEAIDRRSLQLEQETLVKTVCRANPNTVVVLVSSFPYAITWTQHNAPAILHMAQNSQETGSALADVLFGDYNPAGRLVHTWVTSMDELPPKLDYNLRNGRTYMYYDGEPLYPFGHGLSYTTFAYDNLSTSAETLPEGGELIVSVEVTNTGARAGEEVVQLYVQHPVSAVARPKKELKGFDRIMLEPGETKTVQFPLKAADLAYWDSDTDQWVVEEKPLRLQIGASSADIRLQKTVQVGG